MVTNTVLELGDFVEDASRNAALTDQRLTLGDLSGPQQVVLAGLRICHSDHDIHCGLSVISPHGPPETIAASDDVPVRVDWLQHELRQGPLVGADSGATLVIRDLAAEERWPDFGRMCVAVMNMRSMVSIRIPVARPNRARLDFYSSEPSAFDSLNLRSASRLARLAAPMVTTLISEFSEVLVHAAPSDCSRVAVAVGTLIARYRVNSADAFDLLRDASHDLRRPLLGVAIDVVADGRLPDEAIVSEWRQGAAERRAVQARNDPGAAAPPGVLTQHRGSPVHPHRFGGQQHGTHAEPSIGGPEMWRDPSTPNR
jgi:hypothetical protein